MMFLLVNVTLDAGEEAEFAHAAHIWCICGRLVEQKKKCGSNGSTCFEEKLLSHQT